MGNTRRSHAQLNTARINQLPALAEFPATICAAKQRGPFQTRRRLSEAKAAGRLAFRRFAAFYLASGALGSGGVSGARGAAGAAGVDGIGADAGAVEAGAGTAGVS